MTEQKQNAGLGIKRKKSRLNENKVTAVLHVWLVDNNIKWLKYISSRLKNIMFCSLNGDNNYETYFIENDFVFISASVPSRSQGS